jgi:hypothetical protein
VAAPRRAVITGAGEPGSLELRSLTAPLILVAARARRRPGRWALPALGLALASAFACAVAAEATIAGDQGARSVLASLPALQRTVTVTWQGPVSPSIDHRARALLDGLGLHSQTRVALLGPVRLSGVVVRPAGIEPLARWVDVGPQSALGPCRSRACPMLLVGGALRRRGLSAPGITIRVAGDGTLRSAAPLGFTPASTPGPPLLVTNDVSGLGSLAALDGLYRTNSWLALPALSRLHSWQLAAFQRRLERAQATLLQSASQFSLSAPFDGLESAQAEASAAPQRLLPAGGGALAALSVFVILTAYGLRRDQRAELRRLRAAGARASQRMVFVLAEAGCLSGVGLLAGAALGVAVAAVLAAAAGLPAGAVLAHGPVTGTGAAALLAGWIAATTVIGLVLLLPGGAIADVLAIAATAALALALTRGADSGGPLPVLLAPLACVAGGVLIYLLAATALRAGERLSRRGPLAVRLALVSLARAPVAPALAVAFIAVSTGLGGFALGYRATLQRGTADEAANVVPLDALIAPTASFATPLELASLNRWRLIAGGPVLPVRRTDASFAGAGETVTVPALGIPAAGLALIHGWRASDGSAPLATLARRLQPTGPVRTPGPRLLAGARWLSLRMSAPGGGVEVTADLRNATGTITQASLGLAAARPRTARARLPAGSVELDAIELDEPTGLEATSGHQNGEDAAAATQFSIAVRVGPMLALDAAGRPLENLSFGGWRGVDAASGVSATPTSLRLAFADSGDPGIIRPLQPSDLDPLPVLVDPGTAAAASRSRRLALTVDGLPVTARIVGVLKRFPTLPAGSAGFVIADESALAGTLDASLPGQGRPDELWISTDHPRRLRAALSRGPLHSLSAGFLSSVERSLRSDPIARGVLATFAFGAAVSAGLALVGLLVALLGAMRDRRVELDLAVQGLGPRMLRRELALRILAASSLGIVGGLVLAAVLTRLVVAAVRAAGAVAVPDPPLVTVAPWGQLALLAIAGTAVFTAVSWLAAGAAIGRSSPR